MKKWCIILAILLLLTGCGKEEIPVDRPPSLEISYGESSVYAQTSAYQWYWKDGRETANATVDAAALGITMDKLPYLNATKDTALQLEFSEEPDRVLIQYYSAADNYSVGKEIDMVGGSTPAPLDGEDHLYTVSAVWLEGDTKNWGSCTYQFLFLAKGGVISSPIQMEVAADLDLAGLLQLDASQVWGLEFLNNLEGTTRTCRSSEDKTAVLNLLKSGLAANLQPTNEAAPTMEYMMRIVTVSGSQLTVGYAGSGNGGFVEVGGVTYKVGALDMASLWSSLSAGTMSQEAVAAGKSYLEMSDAFPGDSWGSEFVYGYLTQMDQGITYDEMRWLEDAAAPNGFTLEPGWTGQAAALAADCQFWILEDHHAPYCRVTAEDLWQWTQDAEHDVLYRIYTSGGEVIAICPQYLP